MWKGLKHWSRVTQEVCHSYHGNDQQFPWHSELAIPGRSWDKQAQKQMIEDRPVQATNWSAAMAGPCESRKPRKDERINTLHEIILLKTNLHKRPLFQQKNYFAVALQPKQTIWTICARKKSNSRKTTSIYFRFVSFFIFHSHWQLNALTKSVMI